MTFEDSLSTLVWTNSRDIHENEITYYGGGESTARMIIVQLSQSIESTKLRHDPMLPRDWSAPHHLGCPRRMVRFMMFKTSPFPTHFLSV
jgi:hypothetical protein